MNMGSSEVPGAQNNQQNKPCPLKALGPGFGTFNATCEVTNKIDINKYFELMREEYKEKKVKKPSSPRSPAPPKQFGRSNSSGDIHGSSSSTTNFNLNNNVLPLSPRKKKNAKKRSSCDEKSLSIYAAKNNVKHSETYFNYDLSGHIIESGEGESHANEHHLSRQKSWDLSNSKVKNFQGDQEEFSDNEDDLSLSYSSGDFRDILNNNKPVLKPSKSCETVSDLGERHKHHAMMQGKIGSVSQQNRRHRRRLYKKEKKSFDSEVNQMITNKLVIDNG